ncbi:hypothetical protein HPB50_029219 [Hyalomma asiaticum]|nr:hypothetical protein HPB50_029219 [Hyalomma asiaticum]
MKTTKLQFQLLDPRSSDELGAAAKMTVDDAPTTDSLLAFRRALDAEHATDRTEPTPLLTDRARSGYARNEPRRKTATRNMTKIVSKKMSKKTTSKSTKNKKNKATRNPTTTPAEGPRKKTVAIKMGKRSTGDHRSGRRVTTVGARKGAPKQRPRMLKTTRKKSRRKANAPDAETTSTTAAGAAGEDRADAIAEEDDRDSEALENEEPSDATQPIEQ